MTEETFGPYRIEELLGRGGMGEVHRAYDTTHDRIVALKRLSPGYHDDEDYRARFRREARIVARLREPHVIPIHAYGEIDDRLYLDMRLVEGSDLSDLINGRTLDPARAVRIVEQVASALDAAHADGLVHRDVKPSNILVAAGDFVYLVDFGIARSSSPAATSLTASGSVVGTLDYMAPERFESGPVDGRADVYALACVLFACLAGRRPFTAEGTAAQIWAHMKEEPPKASPLNPSVPPALDGVIAKGMAKSPDDRYASAGEFAQAAAQALTGSAAAVGMAGVAGLVGVVGPATPPGGAAGVVGPGTPPGGQPMPGGAAGAAGPATPPGEQAVPGAAGAPGGQPASGAAAVVGGQAAPGAAVAHGGPVAPGVGVAPAGNAGQVRPLTPQAPPAGQAAHATPPGGWPRAAAAGPLGSAQFPRPTTPQQGPPAFHTGPQPVHPQPYPPNRTRTTSPARRAALVGGVIAVVAGIVATALIIGNRENTLGSGTSTSTTTTPSSTSSTSSAPPTTTTTRSPQDDALLAALPGVFKTAVNSCVPVKPDNGPVAAVRCTRANGPDDDIYAKPAESEFRLFADRAAQDAYFLGLVTSRGIPRMDDRGGCRPKVDVIHYALYYRNTAGPLPGEFTTCFIADGNAQVWWVDSKTLTIGVLKRPGDINVLDKLDLWWNSMILSNPN
ncbi:serine/threonine-protein kinase [Lentzea sp. HUAS12]|uniref:serine/threonine-protein kinase n=1 Tax=Lentzea sp. HUAS12 TaxID=2951806 RepID=UPI00209E207C|nr:serine/threonine-protein kinase [Lentzea sp. HUAS12]USX54733.1 protein kinase [Lentzea sp. HUAS12]